MNRQKKSDFSKYKLPTGLLINVNDFIEINNLFELSSYNFNSYKYRKNSLILYSHTDICFVFLKITNIFEINGNIVFYGDLMSGHYIDDLNIYRLSKLFDKAHRYFDSMINQDYSCYNLYKDDDDFIIFPTHNFVDL